jgi:hypothetical protein
LSKIMARMRPEWRREGLRDAFILRASSISRRASRLSIRSMSRKCLGVMAVHPPGAA